MLFLEFSTNGLHLKKKNRQTSCDYLLEKEEITKPPVTDEQSTRQTSELTLL